VSQPRDLTGHQRGQAHRAAIRQVMAEHMRGSPLRRHLKGKEIQKRLLGMDIDLQLSTVLLYVSEIHAEAETEASRDLASETF
jgi:hypothetical protein